MKKKGFTLIELIIALGLLSLLGIVIVTNTTGLLTEEQDKQYDAWKEKLNDAACAYLELSYDEAKTIKAQCLSTGSSEIPISSLLGSGLLVDNDLIKPTNHAAIDTSLNIKVTCDDGVFTCSYE